MENEIFYLYYASIGLDGDIPVRMFSTQDELVEYINDELHPEYDNLGNPLCTTKDIVFLVSYKDEIYVTHSLFYAIHFIQSIENIGDGYSEDEYKIHLHEYPSFQEAYTVALSMKETNKLCYSSETLSSPYWNNATPEFLESLNQ